MIAIGFIWLIWTLSWVLAPLPPVPGRHFTDSHAQEPVGYRALIGIGMGIFIVGLFFKDADEIPVQGATILVVSGLSITWWARAYLGRNFSTSVFPVKDVQYVTQGPYQYNAHPIYSGFCIALLATAGGRGSVYAIIGSGLVLIGFIWKAWIETRLLNERLNG